MSKVQVLGKNIENTKIILDKIIPDIESRLGISTDFLIKVRLHDTRKSFDKQLNRKTSDWEVGNTSDKNEIDIIHEDSFEKYSSHPRDDFPRILKHEISHIYINKISDGKMIPMWLNEGLSMYLADQMTQYRDKGIFVENDYLSKISTEYGWNKYSNYSAYAYSCLFVDFLINKYSLNKVVELVKKLKSNYSCNAFDKLFLSVFNKSLEDIEKNFVETLK